MTTGLKRGENKDQKTPAEGSHRPQDSHRLNFSRAKTKTLAVLHKTLSELAEDSSELRSDNEGHEVAELEEFAPVEGLLNQEDPEKTPPCSPPTICICTSN